MVVIDVMEYSSRRTMRRDTNIDTSWAEERKIPVEEARLESCCRIVLVVLLKGAIALSRGTDQ